MTDKAGKTAWFPFTAAPASDRAGEYEATRPHGQGRPRIERVYWNGRRWCPPENRRGALDTGAYLNWRGLRLASR